MQNRHDLSAAALAYAELGYAVFPCIAGTKHPLTKHGLKDATSDIAQVEAWWNETPNANIAIATDGLLVLDTDGANNPWLCQDRNAELSRGAVAETPRGGFHFYFRQPDGRNWPNTQSKIAPHVDTRACGGYAMLAPSVFNGQPYRWLPGFELAEPRDKLPEPPAWLIQMLDRLYEERNTVAQSAGHSIPTGQRNGTLARLAGTMRRVGMTPTEILGALALVNQERCEPPLEQREVEKVARSIARYAPNEITVALIEDHYGQQFGRGAENIFTAAAKLTEEYPDMCRPIIHGLLREGETMNVISAPKAGKSWLVLNLALSVSAGTPWLEFPTERGAVLLLDNELHPETLANRIPRVADALGLPVSAWKEYFFVRALRGQLEDLFRMESYFNALPPDFFKLVVLDAFYRFMPRDMDENDNGTMANLYNVIDRCARKLRTGFVLIHHTSKGIQSAKGITDVGAGAGAQSRAADCHLVLRPHQNDGCLSVDAVTRSWSSPSSFVIRSAFPLWIPDPTLDPADLKKPQAQARSNRSGEPDYVPEEETWTVDSFVKAFLCEQPKTKPAILVEANEKGLNDHRAEKYIEKALARGLIHRWVFGHNRAAYATIQQPELPLDNPEPQKSEISKGEIVAKALRENPNLGVREIARQCGASPGYVTKIRKEQAK